MEGLRIVKSGSNIHTIKTLDDLNYDSTYPALKQVDPSLLSPSTTDGIYDLYAGNSWTAEITHNLGYFPSYLAFVTDDAGNVIPENGRYDNGTYGITFSISFWDTNKMRFSVAFFTAGPAVGVHYKLHVKIFYDKTGF